MEESIKIKAQILDKKEVLKNAKFYEHEPLLCFSPYADALQALRNYFKEHPIGAGVKVELLFRPYPGDPHERAKNFFFALRDRLAEKIGDTTREHKDQLYRDCIRDLEFRDIDYSVKESIRDLTRYELWQATEHMMDWLAEAEAYVSDLRAEYEDVKKEYFESEDTGS